MAQDGTNGAGQKSLLDSPWAQRAPTQPGQNPVLPPALVDQFGFNLRPRTDDPAFQPPRDPLANPAAAQARAKIIVRELPITTVQQQWGVSDVSAALADHMTGLFLSSGDLCDVILGDDRVQATIGSRTGGLFGQPIRHHLPKRVKDSKAAKECRDAWADHWEHGFPEATLSEIQTYGIMLGFCTGQTTWDTSGKLWKPYLMPFNPKYTFYLPQWRALMAMTQDGIGVVTPGDGKWFLHAPHGEYRGWIRGAIRAVATPWLMRNFALRDWARYSERHGMPMILAKTPAAGDPVQRALFTSSLASIGQEVVVELPQGVDKQYSYDMDLLEASDRNWEAFPGLIDRCDMQIVLAIMYQNLTTEVKEGSYAAARVHSDVRQSALEADNSALRLSIYSQIARPFAAFNFGDPDLAPMTDWDVKAPEDYNSKAKTFQELAMGIAQLRNAGLAPVKVRSFVRRFGVDVGKLKDIDPLQVEAKLAQATGTVSESAGADKSKEAAKKSAAKPLEPVKKKKGDDEEDDA